MKVVMVEPGQYAQITEINESLESLQAAVGGLIDCAYPWTERVCIVCNDEGMINGMPMNRAVEQYGALAGPFFVCGINEENFCSLTEEQAERYKNLFLKPELYVPHRNGLLRLPYDDPCLPGAPEEVKEQFHHRKNLPDLCFCSLPGIERTMLLQYGVDGYITIESMPVGMNAEKYADALNKQIHVTKAQQSAMMCGALIDWRLQQADPARYDENGEPKKRGIKRNEIER